MIQSFVGFRIPLWIRQAVTNIPAFMVVAMSHNATQSLVISQLVLSFALPLPMIGDADASC